MFSIQFIHRKYERLRKMKFVVPVARRILCGPVAFSKSCLTFLLVIALLFFFVTFMYASRKTSSAQLEFSSLHGAMNQFVSPHHLQVELTSTRNFEIPIHAKKAKIIILSYPRSGSSFLGDIFNHHPGVFYLFEPLITVQRRFSRDSLFEYDFSSSSYQTAANEFLSNVVRCNFERSNFTRYIREAERNKSLALKSSPFCSQDGSCKKLKPRQLEYVCRNSYSVFAAKVLSPRVPTSSDWIRTFLQSCSSVNNANQCRIFLLVRDPRAVAYSLKTVHFFRRKKDQQREFSWFVKKMCRQMELDLSGISTLKTLLPNGYRLIRFEDLAGNPFSMVSELYKFVGMEMSDEVKQWLYEATKAGNAHKGAYETIRDPKEVLEKWKKKMSPAQVKIVEDHCARVIIQLNYSLT